MVLGTYSWFCAYKWLFISIAEIQTKVGCLQGKYNPFTISLAPKVKIFRKYLQTHNVFLAIDNILFKKTLLWATKVWIKIFN